MKLSSILLPNRIVLDLQARTIGDAVSEILERVEGVSFELPIPVITSAVLKREDVASTATTHAIAIPHARIPQLRDFYVLLGRAKSPFEDLGTDGRAVELVFLVLCNDQKNTLMLQSLAAVATIAHDEALLAHIREGRTREAIWKAIDRAAVQIRPELLAKDIMRPVPVTANVDMLLAEYLDRCSVAGIHYAPVCDEAGRVVGAMSSREIVNAGFPNYLDSLRNLSFLNAAEPFQELFKLEAGARVGEIMDRDPLVVRAEDPLIQVIFGMRKHEHRLAFVEAGDRCVGVVDRDDICDRILRA